MAISCRVQASRITVPTKPSALQRPLLRRAFKCGWADNNVRTWGAAALRPYATLGIFVEFAFGDWELVSVFGDPDVQRGEQENAEQQSTDQAANDDDRKRPLGV